LRTLFKKADFDIDKYNLTNVFSYINYIDYNN